AMPDGHVVPLSVEHGVPADLMPEPPGQQNRQMGLPPACTDQARRKVKKRPGACVPVSLAPEPSPSGAAPPAWPIRRGLPSAARDDLSLAAGRRAGSTAAAPP